MSEVKPELLRSAIQSAVDCATAELRSELEEVKRERDDLKDEVALLRLDIAHKEELDN